jgi:PBP1b-binding outer membrane lipoprotein LpoB
MKKKLIIIVVIVLVLMMFGCGRKDEAPAEDQAVTSESYESTEEEPVETETETESEDTGILSPEFKKTMDDYEAWFDHYCEVMKMYQENPSDLEVMSEMTELLAEESTMLDQMESMDESEMNNAELAYYIEVTARIEKKLLEVADY